MNDDPYLFPGTSVLRNKRDITDAAEWARVEADVTALRVAVLFHRGLQGRYDLPHLRAFHHFIFEDLYDWAGELRTVDIAKTTPFCQVRFLNRFAHDVFAHLARELLADVDRDTYLDRLTTHFANVNALHPFREGNGRAQRAFFAQLANEHGYVIDWETVDPERNDAVSAASLNGNEQPLRDLFGEIVVPVS